MTARGRCVFILTPFASSQARRALRICSEGCTPSRCQISFIPSCSSSSSRIVVFRRTGVIAFHCNAQACARQLTNTCPCYDPARHAH